MTSNSKGTKGRILDAALDLFSERGYDGTSLREIAEHLGLTKAAIYYHFKSKEEILHSLFQEMQANLQALVEWGREQEMTSGFRAEFLTRLADLIYGDSSKLVRLLQENQPVLRSMHGEQEAGDPAHAGPAKAMQPGFWVFDALKILTPGSADLRTRMQVRSAFLTLIFGSFVPQGLDDDLEVSLAERKQAALTLALELLPPIG